MRCYGDKFVWFMKMVFFGLLLVIEFDGRIIMESMDIMILIEKRFLEFNFLLLVGGLELVVVNLLLGLERCLVGVWMNCL